MQFDGVGRISGILPPRQTIVQPVRHSPANPAVRCAWTHHHRQSLLVSSFPEWPWLKSSSIAEKAQLYFGIGPGISPCSERQQNLERLEKAAVRTGGLRTVKLACVTAARFH